MKTYAVYTPSHLLLADLFRESLAVDPDVELDLTEVAQAGDGNYGCDGWGGVTREKVAHWLRAVDENPGGLFVFSDVDVVFTRPFVAWGVEALGDLDVMFQKETANNSTACSGFFMARGTERTRQLFERVLDKMLKGEPHDQKALNHVLASWTRRSVRYGLFDRAVVTNFSNHVKNRHKALLEHLPFDTMRVFHANRCPLDVKPLAMRRAVQKVAKWRK